jgi:hypothetical protein
VPSLYDVPGFREEYDSALAKEAEAARLRDEAWLLTDHTWRIAGIDIRPLTLRDVVRLWAQDHPVMTGGEVTPGDVATLLWQQRARGARRWRWQERRQRRLFELHLCLLPADDVIAFVRDFLTWSLDGDESESGEDRREETVRRESIAAVYIDLLAAEYGWTPSAILDLPMVQIVQLARRIPRRKDRKPWPDHPAKAVRKKYLAKLNEQLRANNDPVEGNNNDRDLTT